MSSRSMDDTFKFFDQLPDDDSHGTATIVLDDGHFILFNESKIHGEAMVEAIQLPGGFVELRAKLLGPRPRRLPGYVK